MVAFLAALSGRSPLFRTGTERITPAARELLHAHGVSAGELLVAHVTGAWAPSSRWGATCPEDYVANVDALETGARIIGFFSLGAEGDGSPGDDTRVWVITGAQDDTGTRRSTLILLPWEY